jgi:hypothetical protein
MEIKLSLALSLLLIVTCSSAQSRLFLKPHIGAQVPYAHYDRSIGKTDDFRPRNFDITDNYGLLLQLKLNNTWSIAAGWSKGSIGWGNRIRIPKRISKNPHQGPGLDHSMSNYIHRFPINCFRTLKDISFLPINRNEDLYLFNLKVHTIFGFSLDYIGHQSRFDNLNEKWAFGYGDVILYQEENTVINRWGGSAMAGIGIQYYHLGKERLELNIHYSQGLRNMVQSNTTYTLNTETFFTRMLARGSFLGATLAYPIRLKSFKASGLPEN